jgi:hypothetical protein
MSTIADHRLRQIIACCHPALAAEEQVALALRTAGGLGIGEIARPFLVSEATVEQRLARAGQKFRQAASTQRRSVMTRARSDRRSGAGPARKPRARPHDLDPPSRQPPGLAARHAGAELAILLASTPPAGACGMVRRMATRRPLTFAKTMMTGKATDSPERTGDYFFSPGTPASVVTECHHRLQPESMQVMKDMMAPLHPERVTAPVVVLGAEHDWLVAPPEDLIATARAYRTTARTLPSGHDMMLDTAWEQAAAAIQAAIAGRHASRSPN